MNTKIFTTRLDLIPGINRIESRMPLKYVKTGLLGCNKIKCFDSMTEIKELGVNHTGKYITGISFLIVDRNEEIKIRKVKQNTGACLYAVDQLENPNSIIFQPGGIYENGYIIRGNIGTTSETQKSRKLWRFFSKEIIKGFNKIKDWYVGPEALKLADSGFRLITMHIDQSREYDLRQRAQRCRG
jgi:hypothetical protein